MATIQLVKPQIVQTTTRTLIDQKQSLALVQTMLHSSLSAIAHARGLFPKKAFDEQYYEMSDKIPPYEDYASATLVKDYASAKHPATFLRVLRRGRSRRVDAFNDWLENAAFPALKEGNLRALQVLVHADSKDRSNVLETYTLTVQYPSAHRSASDTLGVAFTMGKDSVPSSSIANVSLQELLRKLLRLLETMPKLPESRCISLNIFYIDSLSGQMPKGFDVRTTDMLLFPQVENWRKTDGPLQGLDTSIHRSNLSVGYMEPCSAATNTETDLLAACISSKLHFDRPVSNENLLTSTETFCNSHARTRRPSKTMTTAGPMHSATRSVAAPAFIKRASVQEPDQTPLRSQIIRKRHSTRNNLEVASQNNSIAATQMSKVVEMKQNLIDMMQQEEITQGDTQTQLFGLTQHCSPQHTESTESPVKPTSDHSLRCRESGVKLDKPALSPTKVASLLQHRDELQQAAKDRATRQRCKSQSKSVNVQCLCGSIKEDSDTVQCEYCGTWQHVHCHGYVSARDPRIPDQHACYHCLLGTSEAHTMRMLRDLAMKRKGIRLAIERDFHSQADFVKAMNLKAWEAGPIFQHLISEGYLVPSSGSNTQSSQRSGKGPFMLAREGNIYTALLRDLFDPLLLISHHYNLFNNVHTQRTALTQLLLVSQLDSMPPPPPFTPMTSMPHLEAVGTSDVGSDVYTPTHACKPPRAGSKRPLFAANDVSSKKRRIEQSPFPTIRAIQSQAVLQANVLSSSPYHDGEIC